MEFIFLPKDCKRIHILNNSEEPLTIVDPEWWKFIMEDDDDDEVVGNPDPLEVSENV